MFLSRLTAAALVSVFSTGTCLADDLTDIYCELKHGLQRLERGNDTRLTLGRWRSGFCKHWGQHVVDAERHLYALSARDRLC